MLLLDCRIPKNDWDHQIRARNGFALPRIAERANMTVAVATIGNGVSKPAGAERTAKPVEDAGTWEPAVRQIIQYQQLQHDWDGYGAEIPSREVLESAIGLAYCFYEEGVDPPHRVAPGVAGSVIFEWQVADGAYATVEVDAPLHAEVMLIELGKPTQQWTLPTD